MALSIRYVDAKCITEKFISFIECENISGENRANLIMDILNKAELNLENVRWQGYDRAGNISGKVKGLSTIILNKYPKATYAHLIKSINNKCMRNTINSKYDGHIIINMHIF